MKRIALLFCIVTIAQSSKLAAFKRSIMCFKELCACPNSLRQNAAWKIKAFANSKIAGPNPTKHLEIVILKSITHFPQDFCACINVAQELISQGAHVNTCDEDGNSLLRLVCLSKTLDALKQLRVAHLLSQHGASWNVPNQLGQTATHAAAHQSERNPHLIRLGVKNGGKLDNKDRCCYLAPIEMLKPELRKEILSKLR